MSGVGPAVSPSIHTRSPGAASTRRVPTCWISINPQPPPDDASDDERRQREGEGDRSVATPEGRGGDRARRGVRLPASPRRPLALSPSPPRWRQRRVRRLAGSADLGNNHGRVVLVLL